MCNLSIYLFFYYFTWTSPIPRETFSSSPLLAMTLSRLSPSPSSSYQSEKFTCVIVEYVRIIKLEWYAFQVSHEASSSSYWISSSWNGKAQTHRHFSSRNVLYYFSFHYHFIIPYHKTSGLFNVHALFLRTHYCRGFNFGSSYSYSW